MVTSGIAKYRNERHKLLTHATFPLILHAILVKNHTWKTFTINQLIYISQVKIELNYQFKVTVSPPEQCDFMSLQRYNNYNVLLSLFIMFWDQNSNYFNKFI